MSWKQPIPTDLDEVFGTDYLCRDLYIHLLLKSANKDGFWTDEKTKRTFAIRRGQVVFGQNKWGRCLRTSPKTVSRTLTKLSEKYKKVTYSVEQKFSLVTIIDYDDICKMTDSRLTGDLLVTTSKSVKSVKKERDKRKKLEKLTATQIWEIAKRHCVGVEDVRQIQEEVFASIEAGDKYKVKSVSGTVVSWLLRGIKRGEVERLDDIGMMAQKLMYDEQYKETLRLKVQEREKYGLFNFSNVSDQVS